jgi:hypothetical protein
MAPAPASATDTLSIRVAVEVSAIPGRSSSAPQARHRNPACGNCLCEERLLEGMQSVPMTASWSRLARSC